MKHSNKPTITESSLKQFPVSNKIVIQLLEEVLARGAQFRFRAIGLSMLPFIQDGDILTIQPVDFSQLTTGKIAAFRDPKSNKLLIHRIVDKRSNFLMIKADNSHHEHDGWIPPDQILGWIVDIERNGRKIRFGLGVERILIAFLSKHTMLTHITKVLQRKSQIRPM